MKEQEHGYQPEEPKVYEGEILPPLPKPAIVRDRVQVEERLKVIRTELIQYVDKPTLPPPPVILVEQPKPQPESVWEELGGAIGDGIAEVRDFIGEMMPKWRGLRLFR